MQFTNAAYQCDAHTRNGAHDYSFVEDIKLGCHYISPNFPGSNLRRMVKKNDAMMYLEIWRERLLQFGFLLPVPLLDLLQRLNHRRRLVYRGVWFIPAWVTERGKCDTFVSVQIRHKTKLFIFFFSIDLNRSTLKYILFPEDFGFPFRYRS